MKSRLSEFSLDALVCLVQKPGFEIQMTLKGKEVAWNPAGQPHPVPRQVDNACQVSAPEGQI